MFVTEHVHVRTRAELVLDREKPQHAPVVVQTAGRCRLLGQEVASRQLWLRAVDFLARPASTGLCSFLNLSATRGEAYVHLSEAVKPNSLRRRACCSRLSCPCSARRSAAVASPPAGAYAAVATAAVSVASGALRKWLRHATCTATEHGSTTSLLLWQSRQLASLLSRLHGICAVATSRNNIGSTIMQPEKLASAPCFWCLTPHHQSVHS